MPDTISVSELSEHTQDVIKSFGLEAAGLLNDYACAVEDSLIDTLARLKEYKEALSENDIARKEAELKNALLNRRLRTISDLIQRKQHEDIHDPAELPLLGMVPRWIE